MAGYGAESVISSSHFVALATADSLGSTGDSAVIWNVTRRITIKRIYAIITTAIVSSADVVVKFDRRILTNSDTGRGDGDIGVLNIPTTTAIGKVVYKDVNVSLAPGDQIVPQVTTAAAGGGAAGDAYYGFDYIDEPEQATNQTDMVLST